MAGPTLSRFLGLFRLRDASNASRMAAVSAAGEVSVAASQLGEVQATPTANTVLDRLKTIATTLAGSLAVTSTQLGEVQASPTANTVLDRLKTIATTLAGSLAITSTQLGEVQASPTANTVLDRLKTIATALAGTLKIVSGQEIPVAGGGQITSLSSAVGLSALGTIPPTATRVLLQAEDQDIRWSDVANPTTTTGMKLEARQTIEYAGDLSAIRFIAVVTGAKLNVLYYR